jgi:hypothetical protein
MIGTSEACACCDEAIKSTAFCSQGLGVVCRECAHNLRKAVGYLEKHGMRDLYKGDCPDNRKGGKP